MRSRAPRQITTSILAASAASVLLTACADLYIVSTQVELRGDVRVANGGGCSQVLARGGLFGSSSGVSSGDVGNNDLGVSESDEGERYVVIISSFGDELAHRVYDRPFLESHKVDTFQVTTTRGKHFEFSYHGSRVCESPPSPDDAPSDDAATRRD